MNQGILLVDDEPNVISSLTRELNSFQFSNIFSAKNGVEAMEILRNTPDIAVIVSDYRMPGLDGISFLLEAQEICPDATRMILTGVADLELATNAINLGQIFRLLLKPCSSENFINSVKAAIRQYELVTGERDLLQNTLKGSIKILTDLLSTINPDSFSQSNRISALTRKFAKELGLVNAWELELAGALCRIGCVTVPPEILDTWMKGKFLDRNQLAMVDSVGKVGHHLLRNIPRLEKIAEGILYQSAPFQASSNSGKQPVGLEIPLIGRILKIVIDYDRFLFSDQNQRSALNKMTNQSTEYDSDLLKLFREKVLIDAEKENLPKERSDNGLVEIDFDQIESGMVIMGNIFDNKGRLLVSGGTVVTDILKLRLGNYFRIFGLDQTLLIKKPDVGETPLS